MHYHLPVRTRYGLQELQNIHTLLTKYSANNVNNMYCIDIVSIFLL